MLKDETDETKYTTVPETMFLVCSWTSFGVLLKDE